MLYLYETVEMHTATPGGGGGGGVLRKMNIFGGMNFVDISLGSSQICNIFVGHFYAF